MSNTIGLVPGAVTGAYAYRETLRGRWGLVRRLVLASALGGATGGALLLALPPGAFELVVPPLLLLSGLLAGFQPRVSTALARRKAAELAANQHEGGGVTKETTKESVRIEPMLLAGVAITGVYGGYFGAAQGVILLALLGVFVEGGMTQVNGIKNILAGIANLVSAVLFIAIADVWGSPGVADSREVGTLVLIERRTRWGRSTPRT